MGVTLGIEKIILKFPERASMFSAYSVEDSYIYISNFNSDHVNDTRRRQSREL